MIGKTLGLGHFQITNQLGKGGMGEVFQAKDQVLGPDVAIKVLPEECARDTDRFLAATAGTLTMDRSRSACGFFHRILHISSRRR